MLESVQAHVREFLGDCLGAKLQYSLSCVVTGIIRGRTLVGALIGREIETEAYEKHAIKQVDRFLHNDNFKPDEISVAILKMLNLSSGQRVFIAIDWTTTGKFDTLTSSVVTGSRSLPFQWTVADRSAKKKPFEKQHVKALKTLFPADVEFVLLFDAGFDDASFVRFLDKEAKVRFVVRTGPQVCVRRLEEDAFVLLLDCEWERGRVYDWHTVEFSKSKRTEIRFVAVHDHKMDDPWLLLTNLNDPAHLIVRMYGRRFETEEVYKDLKDVRNGMQLKGTKVRTADALKRLLAVASVAYLLMFTAGLHAELKKLHRRYQANTVTSRRVLALWRVGRAILRDTKVSLLSLMSLLWELLRTLGDSLGGSQPCLS